MSDAIFLVCLAAFAALPIALLRRPGPSIGRLAAVVPPTAFMAWGALYARFVLGWWMPEVTAAEAFASVETVMEDSHWTWVWRYLAALGPVTGFTCAGLCVLLAQLLPARRARPVPPPPA